jgi:hypothetical protein
MGREFDSLCQTELCSEQEYLFSVFLYILKKERSHSFHSKIIKKKTTG